MARLAAMVVTIVVACSGTACMGGGDGDAEHYSIAATESCLKERGMNAGRDGAVGQFAGSGGTLLVRRGTYDVHVAFGRDEEEARRLERRLRRTPSHVFVESPLENVVYRKGNVTFFARAVEFPDPATTQIRNCIK